MNKIITVLAICFSLNAAAQKDSTHISDSIIRNNQITAINYVISDMKKVLRRSVNVPDNLYEAFLKIVEAYIEEKNKEFVKPKK